MGTRAVAVIVTVAMATGCFGYNKSAKRWAYVGNTVLILGGGGAIAADQLGSKDISNKNVPMTGGKPYDPPFSGTLLAGAVLVAAGFFGILFNATRPNVKTSR
jgi:hypothetical protein